MAPAEPELPEAAGAEAAAATPGGGEGELQGPDAAVQVSWLVPLPVAKEPHSPTQPLALNCQRLCRLQQSRPSLSNLRFGAAALHSKPWALHPVQLHAPVEALRQRSAAALRV